MRTCISCIAFLSLTRRTSNPLSKGKGLGFRVQGLWRAAGKFEDTWSEYEDWCMRPYATSECGRELLVHEALRY
jgi:hypothetical protein